MSSALPLLSYALLLPPSVLPSLLFALRFLLILFGSRSSNHASSALSSGSLENHKEAEDRDWYSFGSPKRYIKLYPKGNGDNDYFSLYLSPDDPKSLGLNWKRKANFYFVLLNQSGKELHRTPEIGDQLFCAG